MRENFFYTRRQLDLTLSEFHNTEYMSTLQFFNRDINIF